MPLLSDDSLAVLIKEVLEEKRKILQFKEKFENSRYAKALMEYKPTIKKYSKRYGLDWRLIVAQIMQESRFRKEAESPVGARGLMQLMPETASEIKRELDFLYILQNPRENIAAGIYHMKKIFNLYNKTDYINRTKLSLASYNCGVGRIKDAQDIARFYKKSPYQWRYIREYLTKLKNTDWELHIQVWPQGKPKHSYFYGYNETITYVDNIWEMYQIFRKIL
jgi:membrane-bound lytic murein transglycosylase F